MYISAESVCEKAIKKGELMQWLKGDGEYAFPPTHNSDTNAPDYEARVTAFHCAYRGAPNEEWIEQYKDCILLMLGGSVENVHIALWWLAQQFRLEYKNRAAFGLEPASLEEVKNTLESRKCQLQLENAWEEIEEYNANLSRRYCRTFL